MSAAAYGNVRLRECVNTEFAWGFETVFCEGGRKYSLCPLGELPLYALFKYPILLTTIFCIVLEG